MLKTLDVGLQLGVPATLPPRVQLHLRLLLRVLLRKVLHLFPAVRFLYVRRHLLKVGDARRRLGFTSLVCTLEARAPGPQFAPTDRRRLSRFYNRLSQPLFPPSFLGVSRDPGPTPQTAGGSTKGMASLSANVVGATDNPGGQVGNRSTGNFGSPRTVLTHSQEVHLDGLRSPAGSTECVVKTFAVRRSAEGVVGLRFYRDGADLFAPLVVSEVVPASPAALRGIQPGHIIEQIDAHSLQGLSISAVAKMLQGTPGSNVRLTTGEPAKLATRQAPSGRLASGASSIYSEWFGFDAKSPEGSTGAAAAWSASSPGRNPGADPLGAHTSRHYQTVKITRDKDGSVGLTFCQQPNRKSAGPFEIFDVAPGGAAARTMKIAPGDLIYRIGRWDVTELLPDNVTELLRGTPGSVVELELAKHAGKNEAHSSHSSREGSVVVDVVDLKISLDINSATAGIAGSRQRTAFEEVLLRDLATASQVCEDVAGRRA